MMLSQQLSGINAIMFYSTKIFLAAGLDEPKKGTVFVGIINVILSGVCVVLIERFGRKVSCSQSITMSGSSGNQSRASPVQNLSSPEPLQAPDSGVVIFYKSLNSDILMRLNFRHYIWLVLSVCLQWQQVLVSQWVSVARKKCALVMKAPFQFYPRSLSWFLSPSFNVDRDQFQCSSLQNFLMIFWGI